MKASGLKFLASLILAAFYALLCAGHKQYVYLKAVQCQYNPKLLANVSCFAKSYSRIISKATVQATLTIPQTVVMLDFKMQYKYGTIYRDVLGIPRKFDWCYYMGRMEEFRKHPLANEVIKILDNGAPGFIRPCPWKEIRLHNMTIDTTSLISMWPAGDYKVILYLLAGTEDFLNLTFIGSFRTPLKESFG